MIEERQPLDHRIRFQGGIVARLPVLKIGHGSHEIEVLGQRALGASVEFEVRKARGLALDARQHLPGDAARRLQCAGRGIDIAQRLAVGLRDLRIASACRGQRGARAVEHIEDAEVGGRGNDVEAVAARGCAGDGDRHAVEADRLARDIGRCRDRGRRAVLQDGVGGAAARHAELQRIARAGERGRVGDIAAADARLRDTGCGLGREDAVAGARRKEHRAAVERERQRGRCLGRRGARAADELHAAGRIEKRRRTGALAGEEVRAGGIAAVRDREQLRADLRDLIAQMLAFDIAVRRVAGRDDRVARLLHERARIGERALGLRHRAAARIDGALAGLAAHDGGRRTFGTRRRGRIVARLADALLRGHALLRFGQFGLRALQVGDAGVERLRGADSHGVSRRQRRLIGRSRAASRRPPARPAASWPPPGSSAGTGSGAPLPRRG